MKDASVVYINNSEFKRLNELCLAKQASCYSIDNIIYFGVKADLMSNKAVPKDGAIIILTEDYSGSIYVKHGIVTTFTIHSV